jgi:hypothetical protein
MPTRLTHGDDIVVALNDAGEIGRDDVTSAAVSRRTAGRRRWGDDMLAAVVAGAAQIGDGRDHVGGVGVAAGLRIEQGDVAGGRVSHRRAGGPEVRIPVADVAFAGAAGEAKGQRGNGAVGLNRRKSKSSKVG